MFGSAWGGVGVRTNRGNIISSWILKKQWGGTNRGNIISSWILQKNMGEGGTGKSYTFRSKKTVLGGTNRGNFILSGARRQC